MLERANATTEDDDGKAGAGSAASGEFSVDPQLVAGEIAIDDELQAAIEYKIAASGVSGAGKVIELLNIALLRLAR